MTAEKAETSRPSPKVAGSVAWSLIAQLAPLAAALVSIPLLTQRLGTERFGLLSFCWMIVGYFSLFDLGIGRAITQAASAKLGAGRSGELRHLAKIGLWTMLSLGVVGAAACWLAGPTILYATHISPAVFEEARPALRALAIAIPVVILSTGFRGLLEALQQFKAISLIGTLIGAGTFLAPLLMTSLSPDLTGIVLSLVILRTIGLALYLVLFLKCAPPADPQSRTSINDLKSLLRFGGWITVSNIVGPVMVYFDRFLIGALLGLTAVTYYVIPYDIVVRVLVVPTALLTVVFPLMAGSAQSNRPRAAHLYTRSLLALLFALTPALSLLFLFAHEGLQWWLTPEFANRGTRVMQVLIVGVLANSLAFIPAGLVTSSGRPDYAAKLHLVELPVYAAMLYVLTTVLGIEGAAIAWTARTVIDLVGLTWLSRRTTPGTERGSLHTAQTFLLLICLWLIGSQLNSVGWRLGLGAVTVILIWGVLWQFHLEPEERLKMLLRARSMLTMAGSILSRHQAK